MKKTLLLASAALAIVATQAQAQDGGYDWSGSYIGIEGGYVDLAFDFGGTDDTSADDFSEDGFIGGVYAGHDWQRGRWVYGVVGDFDGLDLDEVAFDSIGFLGKGESYTYDVDWIATARVRAGYTPSERLLVYGTGGVAFAHIDASVEVFSLSPDPVEDSVSSVEVGGAIGAGLEYAFGENWSVKAEYLHYAFGEVSLDVGGGEVAEFDPSFNAVKFGIAYRF